MNKIERYTPMAIIAEAITSPYAPRMTLSRDGEYVTYESHVKEMGRLQSELDALKSVQKSKIIDAIATHAEEGIKELVRKANMAFYTANPCNNLTQAEIELMKQRISEGLSHGQIRSEVATMGFKVSKPIKMASLHGGFVSDDGGLSDRMVTFEERPKLLCLKSDLTSFVAGKRYAFERDANEQVLIMQDEYVSSFGADDCWVCFDGGEYLYVESVTTKGSKKAIFKKP